MKKDEKGYLKNNKEKNICGNCNKQLAKNDKYCPYCGTKRGERKFLPFLNQTLLVYGPPISYYYKCKKCGHKWRTLTLGGDKNLFCPKCGTSSIKTTRGIPSFDMMMTEFPEEVSFINVLKDKIKKGMEMFKYKRVLKKTNKWNDKKVKECAKEKGLKHNITKVKFSMDCISKIKGMGTE